MSGFDLTNWIEFPPSAGRQASLELEAPSGSTTRRHVNVKGLPMCESAPFIMHVAAMEGVRTCSNPLFVGCWSVVLQLFFGCTVADGTCSALSRALYMRCFNHAIPSPTHACGNEKWSSFGYSRASIVPPSDLTASM